jgi:hypothetical protein
VVEEVRLDCLLVEVVGQTQLALADAADTVEGDKLLARTVKESG